MTERAWEYLITIATGLVCGAAVAFVVLLFAGCTPAQSQMLQNSGKYTELGLRFAACAQSVLAEDERQKLNERHEAARLAEEEAEAIADAAREHPPSVKQEIDKVLKDGAK